jgi:hypothetical protein
MPLAPTRRSFSGKRSQQQYLSELRRYNLTVGEFYTVQSFKNPAVKRTGQLIRVTATGYNFFDNTNLSCILDACIYETRESKLKSDKHKIFLAPPTFIIEKVRK